MRLYARYFIWRFSTVIAVTFVVYILCLNQFYPEGKLWISAMSDNQWLRDEGGEEAQWAVAYAQMCACFVFVFNIVFVSGTFLRRVQFIWDFVPFRNYYWLAVSLIAIVLQGLFTFGMLANGPFSIASLTWKFAIGFAWPLVAVPIQEWVKSQDKREFIRFQKRSKLEFNTKLGCYSPV